jgi:hypothetical protein
LEDRLAHPAFAPLRPWLEQLPDPLHASLEELNRVALAAGIRNDRGKPLRFVPPEAAPAGYGDYELRAYETGCVATRAGSLHDLFNALAWLAFPRTKAVLNALHAREIPREAGRRGRFRDLLTIVDEGGAIVACDDPELARLVAELRWKELFWEHRARVLEGMRVLVLGHAVLERALDPWPAIACKAIFVPAAGNPDAHAAEFLAALGSDAVPRDLPPLPVFGYPGWHPGTRDAGFYDDARCFRSSRAVREKRSAPPRPGAAPR